MRTSSHLEFLINLRLRNAVQLQATAVVFMRQPTPISFLMPVIALGQCWVPTRGDLILLTCPSFPRDEGHKIAWWLRRRGHESVSGRKIMRSDHKQTPSPGSYLFFSERGDCIIPVANDSPILIPFENQEILTDFLPPWWWEVGDEEI